MTYVIPNPIPIACVTCLQPMRVESQLAMPGPEDWGKERCGPLASFL